MVLRLLRHPNVISCYAYRFNLPKIYIFLEYADAGELFDLIGTYVDTA